MSEIRTFEDLKCWQACRALRQFVMKEVVPVLPREERFRLADQIIRSSRSGTNNIAEGYGRYHYLENSKFRSISRGSCAETLDHLINAHDDEMITHATYEKGRELALDAFKLTSGYITYLKSAAQRDKVREEPSTYMTNVDSPYTQNRAEPVPGDVQSRTND